MQWAEGYELVDGTQVTIGRRVQHRKTASGVVARVTETYTAAYRDFDGRRRFEALNTANRREARRKAIEIQIRLDERKPAPRLKRATMTEVLDSYTEHYKTQDLARKSQAKYDADVTKFRVYCAERGIVNPGRFDEEDFNRYLQYLKTLTHKQGSGYASKTLYGAMVMVKQAFKHAWRTGLIPEFKLAGAKLPHARAKPQPCFTAEQIDQLLESTDGTLRAAIATLAFAGLRLGELLQLEWSDVRLETGELGMLHIRRGGSSGTTKDKEHRIIPISPRLRPLLEALPKTSQRVFPDLRDRTLLAVIKRLCTKLGFGSSYKVHSFRHFFCSNAAANGVPYRLCLAWMGHSSSDILDLYFHLHDNESIFAMKALAAARAGRE